jgi:TetR/AcrR family transcriptional regulator, transcriptional repressor for nem operon
MARPKEFDETAVLDAAIDCFRDRGFEATSVRDLADRMGICGASLYNAFGDKHRLFLKSLERYLDRSMRERVARLERRHGPKQAIQAFFAETMENALHDPGHRGCLMVNTAMEIAPHDRMVAAAVAAWVEEVRGFFRRNIAAAQAEGSVAPDLEPEDMASLLLGLLLGIRGISRSNPDRRLLEGMLRPALALLDRPQLDRPQLDRPQPVSRFK